ncbi:MAG: Nucleoside-diphosphate-sugar epimerases [uncultured Rubrobacteraceae bacterium]|uniref:Nucleoside-diphosphate-sugar epimerases n=1 Tax=uncultured Rubrobacteraceae bacterium TaxID=349277 RepID=A0A6J4NMN8_9ACTN|nr:MAG: Nucleoside-diphosphate-sugar epimerases [uncultured Rubrobacteraceae bacterium]
MDRELHVVLGASGGTGGALVRELISRGHRVRAVSRGGGAPEGAEVMKADVSTPEGAGAASAGAVVVYHAAQPAYTKWAEEFLPMTENVIRGAAAAGAKLVFADNLYMYGPQATQPMTEETPQKAGGKKGKTRILMAGRLLDAHRSGRVRVAVGRSSDYYGPGGTGTIAGETVFGAALAGKTVRWPGSLDAPHTFNFLPDMARALVTLGERAEADGEVWHLPAAEPITGRRFLDLVSEVTGRPVRASVTSRTALRAIGLFSPFIRELTETVYQFEGPFVSDASKFERTFGPFEQTPHPEAVARTVTWFRGRRG